MLKWIGLGVAAVLVFLAIFSLGSKPRINLQDEGDIMKKDASSTNQNAEQNVNQNAKQYASPPSMIIDKNKIYAAVITTSKGIIRADLLAKEAPITVNNFVFLAREKFYDGVVFHRIMKGFMVQTGDPEGTGRGGPGYRFADETVDRDYVRGTLAMANAGPDTNGSQFFIVDKEAPLPRDYTIFGLISPTDNESFASLDAIADTPVAIANGERSKPTEVVTIESVVIEEK